MKSRWMKKMIFVPFFLVAAALVLGCIVMLLWNAILPSVLNVGAITYWQAVGLFVLSRLIFGGFQFGPRGGKFGPPPHVREKWMSMSDEERAKFKAEWKTRCQQRDTPKQ